MRTPKKILWLAILACGALASPAFADDVDGKKKSPWLHDYKKAVALAKKEKKPILMEFTGSDWCPPCMQLTKKVFKSDEFLAWAKKNVILLKLDFPNKKKLPEEEKKQNDALAKKHSIQGFPTVMFLDAEEKVIGKRMVGYSGKKPADWIADAEKNLKP